MLKTRKQLEPTVHIVDDDSAIRNSLSLLMKEAGVNVDTCASAEEFLEKNLANIEGCLVVDVRMPGMSGIELHEMMVEKEFSMPVIIMTGHGDIAMAVKALKKGAFDFIEKPFDAEQLLLKTHLCINESKIRQHHKEIHNKAKNYINRLTKREFEVMELLVKGMQTKLIADKLGISCRTAELHRAKVMEKLQAKSLSEIVKIAILNSELQGSENSILYST